jgi:prepilin-type N-terminal cleavage/methylation domain-containing protein
MFSSKKLVLPFSPKLKIERKNAGFTLIEIITVVTMILIFTSIIVLDKREGEKQFSIRRSAHQLAQDLRRVENMAMTGQDSPKSFGEIFPRGGYGIYFEESSDSYILFCDCNDNGVYDVGAAALSCASSTEGNPWPEKIEEVFLESGVVISNMSPFSPLNITFFPPDPIIRIKPSSGPATTSQAIATLTLEGRTRTIFINTVGLIDID